MATGRIGTTPVLTVRWSKAPAAGTTSLSGLDDNSVSLVYSVGYEQVYRNGTLLSRGNDYTATNGTSITLIDATLAGDIIEVIANATIALTDTYTQSQANGKFINNTLTTTTGDIIYASAANTPARLGIGSSSQVLTVSGGVPTWTTPSSGGMTSLASGTLSGTAAVDITGISGSYNMLEFWMYGVNTNGNGELLRLNGDTGSNYVGFFTRYYNAAAGNGAYSTSYMHVAADTTPDNDASGIVRVQIPMYAQTSGKKIVNIMSYFVSNSGYKTVMNGTYAYHGTTAAITQVNMLTGGGNWTAGNYVLYGVK